MAEESALFEAVRRVNYHVAIRLLEENADPNVSTERGETCLHIAASQAVGFQTAELVESNQIDKIHQRVDLVRQLLKYGAIVDNKDVMGFQPIHACILSSTAGSVEQLLETLKILVDAGADIDVLDGTDKGFNVLHFACAILHSGEYSDEKDQDHVLKVVKIIVEELGVDMMKPAKQRGMLAVHFAAERGHHEVIEYMIDNLVKKGIKSEESAWNLVDNEGNSMLHYAARKKRMELIDWLTTRGSNPALQNEEGQTFDDILHQKPKILYTINSQTNNSGLLKNIFNVCKII